MSATSLSVEDFVALALAQAPQTERGGLGYSMRVATIPRSVGVE